MQGHIPAFQAFEGTQGNKGKLGDCLDIFLFTDLLFSALNLCQINHLNSFQRSSEENVIALSVSIHFIPKGLVVPRYMHIEWSWRQAHALYFERLLSDFYNILTFLLMFGIKLHMWRFVALVKTKIVKMNTWKEEVCICSGKNVDFLYIIKTEVTRWCYYIVLQGSPL